MEAPWVVDSLLEKSLDGFFPYKGNDVQQETHLRDFLNQLQARYHGPQYLSSDPLEFVHHYTDPWDQEVVALVAALLAYGNVKQIRKSVAEALRRMEESAGSPAAFVRNPEPKAFRGFVHRFNVGGDIVTLAKLIQESWERHGSVGAHFLSYLHPDDANISAALARFIAEWRSWARKPKRSSFQYLLTSPSDGSCCKRWCMFLRWMGRRDDVDPGLWTANSPLAETFPDGRTLRADQLIIPLDTHTGRISQYLNLTRRKSLNWEAAVEVTENLKSCHSTDPVRYDFAISRLGILDLCQKSFRVEICRNCELLSVCGFAKSAAKKQR